MDEITKKINFSLKYKEIKIIIQTLIGEVIYSRRTGETKPYKPFFVTLKSIMVEGLNCNCKPSTRFHRRSSILLYPPLEHTTKSTLTKKTLRSEVSSCQLKFIKREFPQLRSNLQLLTEIGCGCSTSSITSSCRGTSTSKLSISTFLI